jgi:type I restriction enzyme S subunit
VNITGSTDLPLSWAVTTLGDLKPARGEGVNPGKQPDVSFELYSVTNFPVGKPQMLKGQEIGSNKQSVEPGTVLLCGINPRINRVWIVSKSSGVPQIASTEWIPFPPLTGILPEYACYFLQQNKIRDYLARRASGVGGSLMRVKAFTCADVPFPLAPLREQRRIVEEIEKQFTRLEAGVGALKRVQANLKRYRAAVLKAAVEGRLVPTEAELARREGRSYEPASELLARMVTQPLLAVSKKAQAGVPVPLKAKHKGPVAPDTADLPKLPERWVWASLEQLSWAASYGTSEKCDYGFPGPPVLRIPNIARGRLDFRDMKTASSESRLDTRNALAPGDFLVIRTNGSRDLIGRGALVEQPLQRPHFYASYLIRFRLEGGVKVGRWISTIWDCDQNRKWIEREAATSAGQYNISLSKLNRLPVPLAPEKEQERIIAEVERRFSVIDELEMQVEANLKRAERLRQAILKRAFEGKLVPQDPNDEPASMLLERIRAERETVGAPLVGARKFRDHNPGTARAGTRPAPTARLGRNRPRAGT